MRKRRVILILLGLVAAGAIVVLCRREREPEYGGKRLSEWVEIYAHPNSQQERFAYEAIRQIGTNAIPYLLDWIRYETPRWRRRVNTSLAGINSTWELPDARQAIRARGVERAFRALGPAAEGAFADLAVILTEPDHPEASWRAVQMLYDRPAGAGLPILVAALTNQQTTSAARQHVLHTFGFVGHNAQINLWQLLYYAQEEGWSLDLRKAATNFVRTLAPEVLEPNWDHSGAVE